MISAETGTSSVPAPGNAEHGIVASGEPGVVPYSNSHPVTGLPPGFTVPVSFAVVRVTDAALPVTTTSPLAGVVNSSSLPAPSPPSPVAVSSKW